MYEEHCDTRDFIRHKQYIDIVDTTTPTFADIDDVTISSVVMDFVRQNFITSTSSY